MPGNSQEPNSYEKRVAGLERAMYAQVEMIRQLQDQLLQAQQQLQFARTAKGP